MFSNVLMQYLVFCKSSSHDDVIKWKHFPLYWPFVRGIHRSPVNSPHKGQWRGALMFSLVCVWINGWVNNREAGYRPHYDVTLMVLQMVSTIALVCYQNCNIQLHLTNIYIYVYIYIYIYNDGRLFKFCFQEYKHDNIILISHITMTLHKSFESTAPWLLSRHLYLGPQHWKHQNIALWLFVRECICITCCLQMYDVRQYYTKLFQFASSLL